MSTKTTYLLEALFFFVIGIVCLLAYLSGASANMKKFSMTGMIVCFFVCFIFVKNALRQGRRK